MDDNKTLTAARAYLARGLSVFPLNGKIPTTANGLHDASNDLAQILEWFPRPRNIAIAVPAGCVVVDVDPRNGGEETFASWCAEHGTEWTATSVAITGRGDGGRHYWFRYSGEKLVKAVGGIDFLRHGKYVVAPPSTTVETYKWLSPLPADLADLPELPAWLLELARPPAQETTQLPVRPREPSGSVDALDEAAHRMTAWESLLARHGWTFVGGAVAGCGDGAKWRHPGSDNAFSATFRHDCLFVYSPNTPFPVTESGNAHGVTLFSALETLDFGGDRRACVRALRDAGYLPSLGVDPDTWIASLASPETTETTRKTLPSAGDADTVAPALALGDPIDWAALWAKDDDIEQRWLSEPLVARGRAHVLYAGAKTGKSLLMLECAAALAAGRPFLDKPAHDPIPVMYCDYEMTDDDVRERLEGFGYGPEDLELLHYFLLGSGNGLDTPAGGDDLVQTAIALQVELVIIDTTARAVAGAENDADTVRAFYRHCGARLKRLGISVVRLDHAGKDATKGQRGTSAKNDDVDVVWRMTARDEGIFDLEATHQRMGWVPRQVPLLLHEEPDSDAMAWRRRGERDYADRAKETAELLDALKAPLKISKRAARKLLKAHRSEKYPDGWKGRDELLSDAFRWRDKVHKNDWAKAEPDNESGGTSNVVPIHREPPGTTGNHRPQAG